MNHPKNHPTNQEYRSSVTAAFSAVTAAVVATLLLAPEAQAVQYTSRFSLGTFVSQESYVEALNGQNQNDFATISTRVFFRATDLGARKFEATLDLRDKHDFFEKLNRELLQLDSQNTFQFREVSASFPNEDGSWYGTFGRFPIPYGSAIHVDGLETGWRASRALRVGAFGGFNPKATGEEYLEFDAKASQAGFYGIFQPKSESWERHFFVSGAVTEQSYDGHQDRVFLTAQTLYQWAAPSQVLVNATWDFIPTGNLQNGLISFHQQVTDRLGVDANLTAIDVIQYNRQASVLETLSPSPFQEGEIELDYRTSPVTTVMLRGQYGHRSLDALNKTEWRLGADISRWLDPHLSLQTWLAIRKNFTSDDRVFHASVAWFSRQWEGDFTIEYGVRSETDQTLHPLSAELALSRLFSNQFYATASLERVADERVEILSLSFRLGLRFGTKDIPPIRDGAPPRGRI